MGSEILRSKAFTRDSYNSGDYFNQIDFTMKSSVWNKALPIGDISGWPFMKEVYKSGSTKLKKHHRERVLSRFLEDLRLRSDLEFLSTNDPKFIKNNVQFLNSGSRQDLGQLFSKFHRKKISTKKF